ncbi:putative Transposon TX1 [Gossypium australe]|uniref:Putative Transposon TX1 n=1 Tax=Gossypium australe TaxID=47621 RepID=A0A5B6WGQ9_9ROSI|nr:putative Transposon TX1 [Gossypium australe]
MKFKAKWKTVNGMKIGNSWYCDPMVLKEKMVNYFSDHFSCPLRKWKMDFVLNFKRLNESEARNLELPFSMEEIKEAVWSCDENKAPGQDDFNICFF